MNYYKDIKEYTVRDGQEMSNFGGYFFFSFFDECSQEHLFKNKDDKRTVISEYFHTHLGSALELPCAQNSPAILNYKNMELHGISSKNFLNKGEEFQYLNVFLAYNNFGLKYVSDSGCFHSLDLEYLHPQFDRYTKNPDPILRGVAQNFLMSHISQNDDDYKLRNLGIILPTLKPTPYFDFELCNNFLGNTYEFTLHPENVKFLLRTQKPLVTRTMDNMRTLRHSADFVDMCDFTPLENFFTEQEMPKEKLSQLSQTIYDTYIKRFDRIADQFAQGGNTK